jgi:hypothetical protein
MAKSKGVLGPEHLAALNKVIDLCTETERMCRDCEECMLDVTPEREKNADQLKVATLLKAKHFPTSK